jgi:hypothetical protein
MNIEVGTNSEMDGETGRRKYRQTHRKSRQRERKIDGQGDR